MFWGTQRLTVCAHGARLCCALCLLVGGVNCAMCAMHSLWVSWDGADWDVCVSSRCAHLLVFTGSLHFLLSVLPFAEIREMAVTQPVLPFPGSESP